jgi:phosphocarrier protein HPr
VGISIRMKFQKTVQVINKLGLHARASAELVKIAMTYKSDIHLNLEGQSVDGKNIMGIMMLAATCGSQITITAEGEDADLALSAIVTVFSNRFGEKE